jgi:hypothetical protein
MHTNEDPNPTPPFMQPQYGDAVDPTVRDGMQPDIGYGQSGFSQPGEATDMIPSEDEEPAMCWLIFTSEGPRYGEMLRLQGKSIIIGRDDDCEVTIQDRTASRQHAKIRVEGQDDDAHYMLHDLATDNGTFVNGTKIPQPTEINNGDIIRIGYTEMMFKRL